ncbi:MAG: helix-turn-helix transcriptional regulator [Clostridia bacterium]|nr:helix-turn-helix transcriptional regulator [Clostridia bacterium]
MSKVNHITTACSYGSIKIKLKDILNERNLTRYQLSKITGTRFEVVNKWYNGNIERIDSDILARFCYALNCKVEDIIEHNL